MTQWNKVYPLTSTVISASVNQIQANWAAIGAALSAEHGALAASTSGTHLYGRVSVMLSAAYASMPAASASTGAILFDTTCGVCRISDGTSWLVSTSSYYSRAHIYSNSTQSIPTTAWTQVVLGSESYDDLDEATNSKFVATATGYYLIIGTITWPQETTNIYQKVAGLYVNTSTRKATDAKYGISEVETEVIDVVSLTALDEVILKAYHNHSANVGILAANLIVTRLS